MWVISLLLAEVQLKVKFSSRVQVFVCLFLSVRNLNTEIFEHSSSSNIYGIYTTLVLVIIPCQGPLAICPTDRE